MTRPGPASGDAPIRGAVIDVDDTLYPQAQWLRGAWEAVADHAASAFGADRAALLTALLAESASGTDRGGLVDRALAAAGRPDIPVPDLVSVFHAYRPSHLDLYPGVRDALTELAGRLPAGVVLLSDGEPVSQEAKIGALGISALVRGAVLSDRFGREFRKPHPRPFLAALDLLGESARTVVMIGDRPGKDVAGAAGVGMRAVRVRTGEYAAQRGPQAWREVDDFAGAVREVLAAAG